MRHQLALLAVLSCIAVGCGPELIEGGLGEAVPSIEVVCRGDDCRGFAETNLRSSQQALSGSLVYSTLLSGYIGRNSQEVAVDPWGNAFITGYQGYYGDNDGYFAKYDPYGQLLYVARFVGTPDKVKVDANGRVYLAGGNWVAKLTADETAFQYFKTLSGWSVTDFAVDQNNWTHVVAVINSTGTSSGHDVIVGELDYTGALLYSTQIGGSGSDYSSSIIIDSSGNRIVSGKTYSTNFPTTWNAIQTTRNGPADGFVATIDAWGTGLLYSTYLGGTGTEGAGGLGLDAAGNLYVAGSATPGFPVPPGAAACVGSGFVAKLNSSGALSYTRCIQISGILAIERATGTAYVGASVDAAGLPVTSNAFQPTFSGFGDGYFLQISPSGAVTYASYLGGSSDDHLTGIALDPASNIYLTGTTHSYNFPWTVNPYVGPGYNSFLTKFSAMPLDLTAPVTSITAPAPGTTVLGTVTVSATASDNVGVTRVDFYLDGTQLLGSDSTPPYSINWVTTNVSPGNHALTSRAFDGAGNSGTSVGVTVNVLDTTPPTVSITAPAEGSTVSGVVTVSASASDNVGVTRVDLYVDETLFIGSDSTPPFSINWSATSTFPGNHALKVRAFDEAGNSGISAGVIVNVRDQQVPTVSITAPVAGSTVSGTVAVSATASDNVGVTRVDFYVDGTQSIGSDSISPFSISWVTTSASPGNHTLTARAFDAAGNSITSAGVSVNVLDTTPPTCAITAPAAGANVSGTVVISATTSDNVGVARVDFYVDGTQLIGSDFSLPYGANWVTTAVSPGNHVLTCKAYDAAGNFGTSAGVGVTVWDQAPPTCTITAPTAGANVSGTVVISATTSDNVGVTRVDFRVDGNLLGSDSTSPFGFNFGTSNLWGNHTLHCQAVDAAGNLGTSVGVTVNVLDQQAPDVVITSPAGGAPVSGTVLVSASASDNAGVTRVDFYVDGTQLLGSDSTSPFSINWVTASVSPGNHTLTARAFDAAGNSRTSVAWPVTVLDQSAPTVSITAPAAGATVSGTVSIAASASDNVGVVRVDCFVDGALIGSDTTAPFSISWATGGVPLGNHVLTCQAYDAAGNSATSAGVAVSVQDQAAPTVSITAPAVGTTVSGTVSIAASASDNVGVVRVDCFVDGTLIGSDSTAPFSVSWATGGVPPGNHVLTCRAYDAAGNSATSVEVAVSVQDQAAPTVAITAPAAGATVSGTVSIAVSASDNVGVVRVDCFVDGTLIGSDSTAPFSISWATGGVPLGNHVLTCRAYDAAGNNSTSSGVTVTVLDTTPPTVSITSPVAAAFVMGTLPVRASATDNVGVTHVELYVDGALIGSDSTSPFSVDWTTAGVSPGNRVLTSKAYDAAGNIGTSSGVTVNVLDDVDVAPECRGIIQFANVASFATLDAYLPSNVATNIVSQRSIAAFVTLEDLSSVDEVGPVRLTQIHEGALAEGYIGPSCVGIFDELAVSADDQAAMVSLVNGISDTELHDVLPNAWNGAVNLLSGRPYASALDISSTSGIGPVSFRSIRNAATLSRPLEDLAAVVNANYGDYFGRIFRHFDWYAIVTDQNQNQENRWMECFGINPAYLPADAQIRTDLATAAEVHASVVGAVSFSNGYHQLIDPAIGLANVDVLAAGRSFFGCYIGYSPTPWNGINQAFFVDVTTGFGVMTETHWSE